MADKKVRNMRAKFRFEDGSSMRRFLADYSELFTKIIVDENEYGSTIVGFYKSNDSAMEKLRKESVLKIRNDGGVYHQIKWN